MWDFNYAERKALAMAVTLVGVGVVGRMLLPVHGGHGPHQNDLVSGSLTETERVVAGQLAKEMRSQTPIAPGEKIDVNTAPIHELRRLPRVGPSLATALITERGNRRFEGASDLERVPGIGPATASRLAPHLEFGATSSVGLRLRRKCGSSPDLINVNRANEAELEALPGVGAVIAERIVQERLQGGPFASPDDLTRVKGIGSKSLESLRSRVCTGSA